MQKTNLWGEVDFFSFVWFEFENFVSPIVFPPPSFKTVGATNFHGQV